MSTNPEKPMEIRFSRRSVATEAFLLAGFVGVGLYLMLMDNILWIALMFLTFFYAIKDFRLLTSRRPQVVVDERGISLRDKLYPWSEISDEKAIHQRSGRAFLEFQSGGKKHSVSIRDFDVTVEQLQEMLVSQRKEAKAIS